ncbi:hypothetical protein PMG11_04730 [Penicillium brasilianum]|uniref:Zn(2)-C6 fungal-type domain-containing protein n=1 Tax=Penicillium brasilianum TaxID=104259 RepID=A0A0F7VJL1_PENBI|nr:hypothetical protein PMG11_04730 [Penicillium brasilianum]
MSSRACDACRSRKVRCDGVPASPENNPCFHCRTSGSVCQYEHTPKKRGPKSKRSVASSRARRMRPPPLGDHDDASVLSTSASPISLADTPAYERQVVTRGPRSPPNANDSVPLSSGATDLNHKIENIHQDLVRSISGIPDSYWSLDAIVERCALIYMDVLFGIRPVVSEARIRANICLKPPRLGANLGVLSCSSRPLISSAKPEDLEEIRSYTLVTALCAATAYMLSTENDPKGAVVGPIFLRASHEMLHIYEDLDVEYPDSTSLIIRAFQAGALHTDGKLRLSWHLFSAALRLGEQMQLQDPRSFQGLDPLEARLRVMTFRIIRISARYHRMLENHPLGICDPAWSALPYLDAGPETTLMVNPSPRNFPQGYESQLLIAFNLFEELWVAASDILTDLECFVRLGLRGAPIIATLAESLQNHFLDPYSSFIGLLDHLPPFLHSPDSVKHPDQAITEIMRRQFWVQRANLFVSYHCLRMLILNRFAQHGLATMIGVQSTKTMIALRKTEIAHDMNVFVINVPIDSLLVNGEACVTKIRYMGATLLEVIHQVQAPQVVKRANSLFSSLLDVLTKLDSRASDELVSEGHAVTAPIF